MGAIIGVDPGKTGAIALWDSDTRGLWVADMPLANGDIDVAGVRDAVLDLMEKTRTTYPHVYIENVGGIGSQSASRSFTFGFVTGAVHAVMVCNNLTITTVTPQKWKGSFNLVRKPGETKPQFKTRSRLLAAELAPEYADLFKRAKDDGRAEAFLIAFYGAAWRRGSYVR